MEAKGGCCIARFSGDPYIGSQVDSIMLRFRPIAPKPAAATVPRSVDYVPAAVGGSRNKRRCVRENKKCRKQRRELPGRHKDGPGSPSSAASPVVTLPLLPEAPELKGSPAEDPSPWLHLPVDMAAMQMQPRWVPQVVSAPQLVRPTWTCVTVERVAEVCEEGEWGLGVEEETRTVLETEEACPGFVTDAWNRVTWVNEAFRRMVGGEQQEGGGGVMVSLVAKEKLPEGGVRAFTCRVRVQYGYREKKSLTAPCDVLLMEGGGCAWRLDVKAALSLGR